MAENTLEWFSYYGRKYSPLIRKLTDKQRSDFVLAIDALFTTGELKELDPVTDMVFSLALEDFKDSQSKKDKRSEINRNNVNNRWHKETPNEANIQPNTNDTTVYDCIPSNTNDTNNTQYNTEHNNTEDNITNHSVVDAYKERGSRGKPELPCNVTSRDTSEPISHSLFNNEKERAAAEEFRNQWLSAKELNNTRAMVEAKIGLERSCGVTIDGEGNFKAMSA